MKLKIFTNHNVPSQKLEVATILLVAILANGCSRMVVVPPCPPCVDPKPSDLVFADLPKPLCEKHEEKSYVYCSEPTTTTLLQGGVAGLAISSADQYATLSLANIKEPVCSNAAMQPQPACVADKLNDFYERDSDVCLFEKAEYDAAMPPTAPETKNRKQIWLKYLTSEACTSIANCRRNWDLFYSSGKGHTADYVPGHDPQILRAPTEVFLKLARSHHYWCEPGPIKAKCAPSGTNEDPTPVAAAVASCQPGLAVIGATLQAAGAGVGGGGAVLTSLSRAMNLDAGATLATEAERQRTMNQNTGTAAATAVKKDGGALASSGAGASGGGSGSGGGPGGSGAAGGAPASVNGLASAESGGAGGGGVNGVGGSESAATADVTGKNKEEEIKVVGSGDYENAAGGGGGRGGQKGGFGFGGLGGGSAPTVGGVSDVAFSKGGPGGPANPLAGLGGGLSDAEFERILQKNSERSLFEIANRRYFQWGGSVMSGEASDAMKKVSP